MSGQSRGRERQRLLAVDRDPDHGESGVAQRLLDHRAEQEVVLDDEDARLIGGVRPAVGFFNSHPALVEERIARPVNPA